jgi:hypothetical protein
MLSPADIARIKADIAALEKALEGCTDSGIRERIQGWIKEAQKKLGENDKKGRS